AALALVERLAHEWVVCGAGLQVQQARDDLQIVADAVVDLAQQDFPLLEGLPQLLFVVDALGDVAEERCEDHAVAVPDLRYGCLGGELFAILATTEDGAALGHWARWGGGFDEPR